MRKAGLRAGVRADEGSFTIKALLRLAANLRRVLAFDLRCEVSLGRMPRTTRRRRPGRAAARPRKGERRELATTFMAGSGMSGWMFGTVRGPAIAALGLKGELGRALMSGRAPLRQVVSKGFASHRADAEIFTKAANGGRFVVIANCEAGGQRVAQRHVRDVCSIFGGNELPARQKKRGVR